MLNAKTHTKITKHILLMWFVMFALSPCVVKEGLFSVTNAEYSKPLNKTKTTAPTSSCQYFQNESQQISAVNQSKIKKQSEPYQIAKNPIAFVQVFSDSNHYSKTFSGNSPPKYILYKRLKVDVV